MSSKPPVKGELPTREDQQNYQWPPQRDPNLAYGNKSRHPVHALIMALPLLMLMAGFFIYYRGEAEQTLSVPIQAESVEMSGVFTGLSATSNRHYLWIEREGVAKAIRLQELQVAILDDLVRGEPVQLQVAPTVHESTTYWVLRVEQSGNVILDNSTGSAGQDSVEQ